MPPQFMSRMEPFTSLKPYQVNPGNHEAECHSLACLLDDSVKMQVG